MTRFTVGRPWLVIAATVAPILALATQLPDVRFDTSTEGFLHAGDPTLLEYNAFRDQFGRDDLILLALRPPRIFDLAFLEKLRSLHRRIEDEAPYVDEVTSLINARATRGSEDELLVEDLLEEWPETEEDLRAVEDFVAGNPSYRNLLISDDRRVTTVAIKTSSYSAAGAKGAVDFDAAFAEADETAPGGEEGRAYLTDEENSEFVAAVRDIVADYDAPDFPISMAGPPVVMDTVKHSMRQEMTRFVRLTLLAIAVFLFILFRRVSAVLFALVVVVLSLAGTVGIMSATDRPLKLATMILPSFLLAVGVGGAVHVLALFFRDFDRGAHKRDAIVAALEHSGLPIILTSLTTAGGLLSFAPAAVAPISDLGIFAPVGVMIALGLTLLLLPALLAAAPIRRRAGGEGGGGGLGRRLDAVIVGAGDLAGGRPGPVIAVSAALAIVAGAGALRLDFSHNPLEWLPEASPVRRATEEIDRELRGSVTMEVLLTRREENGWYDPDALRRLDAAAREVEQYRDGDVFIGRAFSIVDVLKEIHRALNGNDPRYYAVPTDRELIAQEFLLFENSGSDDLEDLVDTPFRQVRLTLKGPWLDAVAYSTTLGTLEERLRDRFGGETTVRITGILALLTRTFTAVMISMVRSYVIAFAVISVLMILLLGSVRLGLVAMLPNLLPIAFALGVMGWFGLPLDAFTLLVGSIALGLAVDDTIHFMHNYRRYLAQRDDSRWAIRRTLATAGRAMLFTTLVLSTGFLIFMLSSMHNISNFGMLTALALAVALAADFLLAPALMQVIHGRGDARG